MSLIRRLLSPVVDLREEESATAALMFAYSLLAMAAYNIVKPVTRSKFISDLGANNLPYVLIGAAVLIGVIMAGYARLMRVLPRRWGLPIVQAAIAVLLVAFWFLFQTGQQWVSVAFFVTGLLLGILLTSQFWTLANVVYDARQAKRLFGFIGGGAPLGGIVAGFVLQQYTRSIGTVNFLLVSAAGMIACAIICAIVISRSSWGAAVTLETREERGVGAGEALQLLRNSRHLQIIALVISFAAIGAAIIEQQLNMAAEAAKGQSATDAITVFLATVTLWTSTIGFVVQVFLTSRIHRMLGIGFALMILPVSLGTTGIVMLLNAALWAPGLARVLDQSLRYTVDKTTREILFLPLPSDVKYRAKPFVDVTVDRFMKGVSALLLLVLIKPWGLHLDWQHLSYASLGVTALWIVMALRARREYLSAFRRSIERREVPAAELPLATADLTTVETLVEELSHPDEQRVLYAIDLLESLDKRNLITPLLLRHESPAVRVRALDAIARARRESAARWVQPIESMLNDQSAEVRVAAVAAVASLRGADAADLVRPLINGGDRRLAVTAAVVLAGGTVEDDVRTAEATLLAIANDTGPESAMARRDVAAALGRIPHVRFRAMLIPLLYDADPDVAEEAMRSVRAVGASDFMFVPTLVALLRHRRLKAAARDVLVGYGPAVLEPLAHFIADPEEDAWIRRHLPATIARIGSAQAVEILVKALGDADGFLRYKAIEALEHVRRENPELAIPREPIERLLLKDARRHFETFTLHHNLFVRAKLARGAVLDRALEEATARAADRLYRLLGLIYPARDIAAARFALEHGDARSQASASEYLDNVLTGTVRRHLVPAFEPLPAEEKARRGYVIVRSRPRDAEETLLQLINDEDAVIAAAAIHLVGELGMWGLADDLEHVLSHRNVRDWYVFEAASWTLGLHRVGGKRLHELWHEPLPATELASQLKTLPLFASVSIVEMFRFAGAGRQVRCEPGKILVTEGSTPDCAYVLLQGHVLARRQGVPGGPLSAPAAIGIRETLEGGAAGETVRTEGPAVVLALSADELRTLVADNIDLLDGLLRTLVTREDSAGIDLVVHGNAAADLLERTASGVPALHKVLLLEHLPLFSRASADQVRNVAAIAREVTFDAGTAVAAGGDEPAMYYVVRGEIASESAPGDPREALRAQIEVARAGDALGIFETLGGRPLGRALHARTAGRMLVIARSDLLDQLAQHPVLAQQVFRSLLPLLPRPATV